MEVLDVGHRFRLDSLDGDFAQIIQYVKRCEPQEKYPGNKDSYPGTTMQEVCRAQISRALSVNGQKECSETKDFIFFQRMSILRLEQRAARIHGRTIIFFREDIENEPTCKLCGHIQCAESCR